MEINSVLDQPILLDEVIALLRKTDNPTEIRLSMKILEKNPTRKVFEAMFTLLARKDVRLYVVQSLKSVSKGRPWIQDYLIREYQQLVKRMDIGLGSAAESREEPSPTSSLAKPLWPKRLTFMEKEHLKEMQEGIIHALQAIGNSHSLHHLIMILTGRAGDFDMPMKTLMLSVMLTIRQRMMQTEPSVSTEAVRRMRDLFNASMHSLRYYRKLWYTSKLWADNNLPKDSATTPHSENEENVFSHLSQALALEIRLQYALNLKILSMCWKQADLDFLFPMLQSDDARERSEAVEISRNLKDFSMLQSTRQPHLRKKRKRARLQGPKERGSSFVQATRIENSIESSKVILRNAKMGEQEMEFTHGFLELLEIVETRAILPAEDSDSGGLMRMNDSKANYDVNSVHFLVTESKSVWLGMLGLLTIGKIQLTSELPLLLRYTEDEHSLLRYAAFWSLIQLGYEQYQSHLEKMSLKIDLVFFLKTVPIFAEVSAEDIVLLSEISKVIRYRVHTELFREGDPGQEFFVVKRGTVGIYKDNVMIAEVGEKDCFGEMAIVEDRMRSATARAEESVELILFDRSDFLKLMMSQPRITYSLFVNANKRLRDLHQKVLQIPRE